MHVREIMTSAVISVPADSTIEDAARILARHRISGLPVVTSDGALVGLVTEYDFISKQGQTVSDIMSRGVISVTEDTDVEEVSHLLTNRRIRRVPVLRGDRLVGIVSRSDLIKQIAMRWVCPVCGEVVRGPEAPEQCPRCHAPKSAFTHEAMNPGM
ncbi:MAG: CBS domain-containing protein [Kouleothrix sp.]|jgi:CBS domain-containing protein/rubredoxin|nr:CBS domain-containing protein [Kouleothrix sp.]